MSPDDKFDQFIEELHYYHNRQDLDEIPRAERNSFRSAVKYLVEYNERHGKNELLQFLGRFQQYQEQVENPEEHIKPKLNITDREYSLAEECAALPRKAKAVRRNTLIGGGLIALGVMGGGIPDLDRKPTIVNMVSGLVGSIGASLWLITGVELIGSLMAGDKSRQRMRSFLASLGEVLHTLDYQMQSPDGPSI